MSFDCTESNERPAKAGRLVVPFFADRPIDSRLQCLWRPVSQPVQAHDEGYRVLSVGAAVYGDACGSANLMQRIVENAGLLRIAHQLAERHTTVLAESARLVEGSAHLYPRAPIGLFYQAHCLGLRVDQATALDATAGTTLGCHRSDVMRYLKTSFLDNERMVIALALLVGGVGACALVILHLL